MWLRCKWREEARVDDFKMQRSSTIGIGTVVGEDVLIHRVE
jgi:hypothetical protein